LSHDWTTGDAATPPDAKSWPPSQHGSSASSWSVSWALQGVRVDGWLGAPVVAIVVAGEGKRRPLLSERHFSVLDGDVPPVLGRCV
jgi:hypothetical protein